ncbi:MAG TPA: hypothetical protein VGY54_24230 [Polyangiaceae bacterium]|jgi:hypothetical protein|nr:hypothetical protein [Polyangiaceae bacterium]
MGRITLLCLALLFASCVPYVRHDATMLSPTAVASLRKGFQIMQSRPASDPTSATYQAAIHATYATPPQQLWNGCQHGTP